MWRLFIMQIIILWRLFINIVLYLDIIGKKTISTVS